MWVTARGWIVLAVIAGSLAMSWQYGPRALNAIVAPLVIVLAASFLITLRRDRPTVRRHPVDDGFVGETREIAFVVETEGDIAATVRDEVGSGLKPVIDDDTKALSTHAILDGETHVTYEVELINRGERAAGPVSITVSDIFGLFVRRYRFDERSELTVYPEIYSLDGELGQRLQNIADATARRSREEFDHLREYRRGDSLRDVHWKAAAKQPEDDLVVTEYAADEGLGSVTVAAECLSGREDDLATAVASIVTALHEANIRVGLVVDGTDIQPDTGSEHYYELLSVLAALEPRAGTASLTDRERADSEVCVTAGTSGTTVSIGDQDAPAHERALEFEFEFEFDRVREAGDGGRTRGEWQGRDRERDPGQGRKSESDQSGERTHQSTGVARGHEDETGTGVTS
ncbi:uncharacterized protein Nmag_1587 [Natrialba magadii ATCC 43099]|uniref:DUF58 domain-containing protein n=1 Tax=Natrialba magadii (strain ATCC 43099 / DSM 3394 / CCM 3739 / CIP 104546 / IAM 13178 / JCM 8861 / NBRC 102185 / NCIMB 2190 / MS3) TaxID=547559 RepID=D3SUA5_NATMM|nr:DUF58 domain-containing protein [Natrialba magadii]ADD05163.1 uncharacterized protein Nmag_1587 [Natrialba magadii ATCC 43099]ELY23201.1 hypothetical protein C500_20466 [Natrialba magadii ATCC 43099]